MQDRLGRVIFPSLALVGHAVHQERLQFRESARCGSRLDLLFIIERARSTRDDGDDMEEGGMGVVLVGDWCLSSVASGGGKDTKI